MDTQPYGLQLVLFCSRLAWVVALHVLAAYLALAGAFPDIAYAVGFRIGIASLGPCILPLEVEVIQPAKDRAFHVPLAWHECSHCKLAQDVPRWNAALLVDQQPSHDSIAAQEPVCNASFNVASKAARTHPPSREAWRSTMGRKPLIVAHARPIKPSEGIPQVGGCSTLKQMHAFLCQSKEVAQARVEGLTLSAVAGLGGGNRGSGDVTLPSAIVLPPRAKLPKDDLNIFHQARLNGAGDSIWCVHQLVSDLQRSTSGPLRLVMPAAERRQRPRWELDVLAAMVPLWTPPARQTNGSFARIHQLQPRVHGSSTAGPAYLYFELDRATDPLLLRLPRTVLASLRIWPPPPPQRHVLVVQRGSSRKLGGMQTGTLAEVLAALCSRGLQVRSEVFDNAPLHLQASLASAASVVVSPHGAHLTNLMWMPEGAALIEVLLRGSACGCDTAGGAARSSACDCGPAYYKADYANLAHTFGVRWFYWDPELIYPLSCVKEQNPIGCKLLLVDAPRLASAAWLLHEEERPYTKPSSKRASSDSRHMASRLPRPRSDASGRPAAH